VVDLGAFREMKSESLVHLLARPGMYGPGVQFTGQALLHDLLNLDGVSWLDWVSPFLSRFGKLGIEGAFVATFGEAPYHAEIASILAEMAYRMNVFQPQGPLLNEDSVLFSKHIRELWWDRDITFDLALEQLPEPTMVIDKRVVSFAPTSGPWITSTSIARVFVVTIEVSATRCTRKGNFCFAISGCLRKRLTKESC
jgi:hypothetical protein